MKNKFSILLCVCIWDVGGKSQQSSNSKIEGTLGYGVWHEGLETSKQYFRDANFIREKDGKFRLY